MVYLEQNKHYSVQALKVHVYTSPWYMSMTIQETVTKTCYTKTNTRNVVSTDSGNLNSKVTQQRRAKLQYEMRKTDSKNPFLTSYQ